MQSIVSSITDRPARSGKAKVCAADEFLHMCVNLGAEVTTVRLETAYRSGAIIWEGVIPAEGGVSFTTCPGPVYALIRHGGPVRFVGYHLEVE